MPKLRVDDDELPEPIPCRDELAWDAVCPGGSLVLRGGYFAIAVVWHTEDGE